jgi:ATP-dependent Lhr-like helicase
LKALEDAGKIRRGYFVAGLGATQFALPGALDLLRSLRGPALGRHDGDAAEVALLAATDPGNPYGATLKWPGTSLPTPNAIRGPTRTVGAIVVLVDGAMAAYLARSEAQLTTCLPEDEPERSRVAHAIARALIARARKPMTGGDDGDAPRGMLIEGIDGVSSTVHPLASYLAHAGFIGGPMGFQATFPSSLSHS